MAMKRIAAMLLVSVLLLSCVGCAQDGRKEPDAEKTDLGLTAEVKPATDFTAKANAAVYDELDFDDKQEYEFATRGLVDAPETLELKDEDGTILWSQEAYAFLDDYEKAPDLLLLKNSVIILIPYLYIPTNFSCNHSIILHPRHICTKYRGLFLGYFLTAYALQTVILLAFGRSFQRVPWHINSIFIIVLITPLPFPLL